MLRYDNAPLKIWAETDVSPDVVATTLLYKGSCTSIRHLYSVTIACRYVSPEQLPTAVLL